MYMRDTPKTHLLIDIIGGADPDTFTQGREVTRPNTESELACAENRAQQTHASEYNHARMREVAAELAKRLKAAKGAPTTDDIDITELEKLLQELLLQLGAEMPVGIRDAAARPGLTVQQSLAKIKQDAERGEAYAARIKERSRVVHDGATDKAASPRTAGRMDAAAYQRLIEERRRG